jgi:transposase
VPPKAIQDPRLLTRYRRTQIAERKREAQRLHKALEEMGIKLDCVATDILGKSGRAMLDALVSGTTDPDLLAELARGKLRPKIPVLREPLEGHFQPLRAVLIGAILGHLDFLDQWIQQISDATDEQMLPFVKQAELLCTIPGVQKRTAEILIAEIGVDMSVFPTAGHLAIVGRTVPRQRPVRRQTPLRQDPQGQQAPQRRAHRRRDGRAAHRRQLPPSALPHQETRLGHGRALRRRQALDAVRGLAHAHHRRALQRTRRRVLLPPLHRETDCYRRRLVHQLERLGHQVTLDPTPRPPDPNADPTLEVIFDSTSGAGYAPAFAVARVAPPGLPRTGRTARNASVDEAR